MLKLHILLAVLAVTQAATISMTEGDDGLPVETLPNEGSIETPDVIDSDDGADHTTPTDDDGDDATQLVVMMMMMMMVMT